MPGWRPSRPGPAVNGAARLDHLVVEQAARIDAGQLRGAVDDYAHAVAPDSLVAVRNGRGPPAGSTSDAPPMTAGGFEASLDKVGCETVLTALAPLSTPTGQSDDRTAEQRRADALVELARRAARAARHVRCAHGGGRGGVRGGDGRHGQGGRLFPRLVGIIERPSRHGPEAGESRQPRGAPYE